MTIRSLEDGQRWYRSPSGVWLPSVTTILAATRPEAEAKRIAAWAERVGEEAAAEPRRSGLHFHAEAAAYLTSGEPPGEPSPFFEAFYAWVPDGVYEVEVPLIGDGYAGTADAASFREGQRTLYDWKTVRYERSLAIADHMLQIAAYAAAYPGAVDLAYVVYISEQAVTEFPAGPLLLDRLYTDFCARRDAFWADHGYLATWLEEDDDAREREPEPGPRPAPGK